MSIISALRRLKQKDCEFEASGCIVRPCVKQANKEMEEIIFICLKHICMKVHETLLRRWR
jgi:hypothetical protein